MLNNIRMGKVASYDDEQALLDLARINFVYGDNGSGKSTIAKFVGGDTGQDYSQCALEWDAYGSVDTLVYNREFVDNTLTDTDVPGVFTFGDGVGTTHDQLKGKISEREQLIHDIASLTDGIDKKNANIQKENKLFNEECWKLHNKYKIKYSAALKGYGVKEKFKTKCVMFVDRVPKLNDEELSVTARTFFFRPTREASQSASY